MIRARRVLEARERERESEMKKKTQWSIRVHVASIGMWLLGLGWMWKMSDHERDDYKAIFQPFKTFDIAWDVGKYSWAEQMRRVFGDRDEARDGEEDKWWRIFSYFG